jgi:integrase
MDAGKGTLANRTLSQLRKLFNWAVERDVLSASPCNGLKAPSSEDTRDRVLTHDEIRWLWKACEEQMFPFGPLAQVLLLTGQRRSEVAGMRAVELCFRNRMWSLPKERTKNGEAHDVPLPDEVVHIIKALPRIAGHGFIFTNTGVTPVSGFSRAKTSLDKLMTEAACLETSKSKTSIEPWTLHDLRRTCASGMAALGIAPHIVESVLNHKSGTIKGVAAVYNRHQYSGEKRQALEAWATRVAEIVAYDSNVIPLRVRSR